jgi:predicted transcriptional regulator
LGHGKDSCEIGNGRTDEMRLLLSKTVSKSSIATIMGVSRTAVHHFTKSRQLS